MAEKALQLVLYVQRGGQSSAPKPGGLLQTVTHYRGVGSPTVGFTVLQANGGPGW